MANVDTIEKITSLLENRKISSKRTFVGKVFMYERHRICNLNLDSLNTFLKKPIYLLKKDEKEFQSIPVFKVKEFPDASKKREKKISNYSFKNAKIFLSTNR